MRASKGEIKIAGVLTMAGIPFKEEYSFPGLVSSSGRALRFDFAVFDEEGNLDFLIEYQGIQHYEAKSKFGGEAGLRKQKYNDQQKRIFCNQNNIKLVIIPYWEEPFINYDYLMKAGYDW